MGKTIDFEANTEACKFLMSNNEVDILQGPVGSGKTVALVTRIMRHAQEQKPSPIDGLRYTRMALIRNTIPDLQRSTIETWLNNFPEKEFGRYIGGAIKHQQIRAFGMHCDVHFMSLDNEDDVRKLRSTEFTVIGFNELGFMIRAAFDEARGRLRYPGPEHGGPTYSGVIADSNAPSEDHWLAIMTGQVELPPGLSETEIDRLKWPKDWGFFKQPPAVLEKFDERGNIVDYVVNPRAENLRNLPDMNSPNPGHLYYQRQITGARQKSWIDSVLMNRVALVVDGSPVWPQFRREYHVSREVLKPVEGRDVTIGIDFGRVYPAVVMGQQIGERDFIQYEMLGFNEGATTFAPKVKRFLERNYTGCRIKLVGDPKGRDKGQATDQSSYEIWRDVFGMSVMPAPVKGNDIATRIEAVANLLNDNPSGINRLVISPLCRTLIVGMSGRYHLVREEDGETRPKKDRYSNLCDALQYWCLGVGEGRRMIGIMPLNEVKPVQYARQRKSLRRVMA